MIYFFVTVSNKLSNLLIEKNDKYAIARRLAVFSATVFTRRIDIFIMGQRKLSPFVRNAV
jgi:hypothetical protein